MELQNHNVANTEQLSQVISRVRNAQKIFSSFSRNR